MKKLFVVIAIFAALSTQYTNAQSSTKARATQKPKLEKVNDVQMETEDAEELKEVDKIKPGKANGDKVQENKKSVETRAKNRTEQLAKKLLLSEDQRSKVYQINLTTFSKVAALKASINENTDKQTVKEQIKQLYQQKVASIKQVLNPEQLKKYEQMIAKKGKNEGKGKGKGKGHGKEGHEKNQENKGKAKPKK